MVDGESSLYLELKGGQEVRVWYDYTPAEADSPPTYDCGGSPGHDSEAVVNRVVPVFRTRWPGEQFDRILFGEDILDALSEDAVNLLADACREAEEEGEDE